MGRKSAVAILALSALVGGGVFFTCCQWFRTDADKPQGVGKPVVGPDAFYSNILPADYVGPGSCGKCHEKQHKLWSAHPHRFMNQLASKAAIKGDFDHHVWKVRPGHAVTFSTHGEDYIMAVDRPAQRTRYKVTRTVGSRFMQFYIGVQTEGPEPPGDRVYTTEHRLPFAYWFRMKRWLPLEYFDVGGDNGVEELKDGLPVVDGVDANLRFLAFRTSCVHCHNTFPHTFRLFSSTLAGFPDAVIEPDMKRLSVALADSVAVEPNDDAFASLHFKLDPNKDLVTVGISCESCHMGGREHASRAKEIAFFPANPHLRLTSLREVKPFTGKRKNPATSQGICAQCHSARAIPTFPNGARIRNSSEAKDLLEGACATQIRCVTCHDPHTAGVPSGGAAVPRHLDACVSCHPKYSTQEQVVAHSRHSAESGVNCLDCHMPRISQGIDEVSRTHRITVPVEQSMISNAAPNACNLCHLDKSVRWTLDELKRSWGREIRPLDATPAESQEQPAGKVWHKSAQPITRMVATDAYSRSPHWKANIPDVLRSLNDGHAPNRAFALFAVERILGRLLAASEIDILEGPAQRLKQIDLLQATLEKKR
jgi:hypothetical protein